MAVLPLPNQDEENDSLGIVQPGGAVNQAPTSDAPEGQSTGSSTALGSAESPAQTTGGVRPSGSSQVEQQGNLSPNVQPYLQSTANQNAIAGQATGIATTLGGETNTAGQAITAGNTQLQNDVTAGTPQVNTQVTNDVVNNPTNVSPLDQAALTQELSGTYSGPTSAANYYTAANQPATTAAQNAEVLEQPNIAGPETYFAGQGVQGTGNQTLDAALYQQTPSAQAAAQPAILAAQAAPANVSGAVAQGNATTIPSGTAGAEATQTATQQALNQGIAGYTAQGNTAAAANVNAYNTLAQQTQQFLQNPVEITGTPTAEQQQALSAIGYTPAQWNQVMAAYNNLAQLQYIQGLVQQSGMPITQDPTTGQFINQLTGDPVVIPTNIPPPAGIDLSKGLTVQEASQLFNIGNSASPQVQSDINALEGFLGQSATGTNAPTGANGTQFTYAPPDLTSGLTTAQQALTTQNNQAQAIINQARANPDAALQSGSTLGVAYAIGGAQLAAAVVQIGIKSLGAASTSSALADGLAATATKLATAAGATPAIVQGVGDAAGAVGAALSVVGSVYGIYNFIAGYQSGNSGADALNGAEAGASIGSFFGPWGTLIGAVVGAAVGAISGLFGYKADPEDAYWQSYIKANAQNPGQNQLVANSTPNPFLALAGFFDQHNVSGDPIYGAFGRGGEGAFTSSMVSQIDKAAQAGTINAYSTPQYVYNQVIQPWITQLGGKWTNTDANIVQPLIQAMIGEYMSGNISSWQGLQGQAAGGALPPFQQFINESYAPTSWLNPTLPGNTTANPIAYNAGPAPTQVATPS